MHWISNTLPVDDEKAAKLSALVIVEIILHVSLMGLESLKREHGHTLQLATKRNPCSFKGSSDLTERMEVQCKYTYNYDKVALCQRLGG
jgi:hypothetical protein